MTMKMESSALPIMLAKVEWSLHWNIVFGYHLAFLQT